MFRSSDAPLSSNHYQENHRKVKKMTMEGKSLNACHSVTTEDVEEVENVSFTRVAHSMSALSSSKGQGGSIIDIRFYRRFATEDIERAFCGYEPDLIEEMVKKINELSMKVAELESHRPEKKRRSTRPLLKVRE